MYQVWEECGHHLHVIRCKSSATLVSWELVLGDKPCLFLPIQLCAGRQRLPHHAVGVQQPLHPDLRGERSRQDRGLQENPAVLCRQLPEYQTPEQRQGQAASLQPGAWGLRHWTPSLETILSAEKYILKSVCGSVYPSRLSEMPKLWRMTTQAALENTWTSSLTTRLTRISPANVMVSFFNLSST